MIVYERKGYKTKVGIALAFLAILLLGCGFFLFQERNKPMIAVSKEEEIIRLQLPSIHKEESVQLPFSVAATPLVHFYSKDKSNEILNQSIVEFEGVYRPSQGVDYGFNDKVFEVKAMLSGEVLEVKEDNLLGKSVTVDSSGLLLTYQSLSSFDVQQGDKINQGQTLGLAGENYYNQSLGIHLHVVAEKENQLLDPEMLIGKKQSEIQ